MNCIQLYSSLIFIKTNKYKTYAGLFIFTNVKHQIF